jgi:hypothetical protein
VQTQAAWEAWQASRDALAAQRDEGLAREAELREQLAAETGYYRSTLRNVLKDNQGVVFETPVLCRSCQQYTSSRDHFDEAGKCKARPGCADGEKAE